MKALVLKGYNELVYEEVARPELGAEDVLVEVKACGICGSDVHGMDGSTGRRLPPIIMGHEASGVIAEVGSNVNDWRKGDRVTFDSTVSCGDCHFCRKGLINLCDNRKVLGVSCEEYRCDGAFAEYVSVPARILYRLPEEISFEQATFTEPLSVAVHAVNRTPISQGDKAVVVGSGMVGLLVVQALRVAGAGEIIAVDIDKNRLELAEQLGADVGLKADECSVKEEVLKRTDGLGADVSLEVVGFAETVKTAEAVLRKGGSLTLIGNFCATVEWPLQSVVTREISVFGSYISRGEYPACLEMISSGKVNVNALISATSPLSEGAAWFKRLYDKEAGLMKVILVP
ncbi:MAG: galactitol-1-phosphate 5-dehydrogenase [Planctomycetota bacterium]|nr:MAG: galactitol-1-phosphate 5-dehydrogenase [Planctomycetota bacterium]